MKRLLAALLLSLIATPAQADKLKVVASFSILGDMVERIADGNVDLKVLVGPDGDAHTYEPTPQDVKAMANADLVIVNGLGFEGWLGRLIMSSGYNKTVVVASKGVDALTLRGTLHEDPHAWQDLKNGHIYAANIRDALIKADPRNATGYRASALHFIEKIDQLDAEIRQEMAAIPDERRKVISTHDAFQYFARAYHVSFIAPMGINPETSLSAGDVAQLMDMIRQKQVQVLFLENISDDRLIRQLEADTGAYLGGTLYSDALSPPDGPAPNYLELFHFNARQLIDGMTHNQ